MALLVSAGELAVALDQKIEGIVEKQYATLTQNLWWPKVMRKRNSVTRLERIMWLVSSAKIERPNAMHGGGQQIFEDMAMNYTEFENLNAVGGLQIKKETMEDVVNGIPGGEAVDMAQQWAEDIGAYMAYWPQQKLVEAITGSATAYDGKAFFATNHDIHPFNSAAGTYSNLFASKPIDTSVSLDVALKNLSDVRTAVAQIKMPNGTTPRYLRVTGMLVPPALMPRAVQLTDSRTDIVSGSNGPESVGAVISYLGLGTPIEVPELGAEFGGSDTTYYLTCEAPGSQLPSFIYSEREPFSTTNHSMYTSAELARKREYQWTCEGRNVVAPGHPFALVKVTG